MGKLTDSNDALMVEGSNAPVAGGSDRSRADELEIRSICAECRRIAAELLDVVRKIAGDDSSALGGAMNKVKAQTHRRKWSSFQQALRYVWNEDKVNNLSNRLQALRQELCVHLLVVLRYVIPDK